MAVRVAGFRTSVRRKLALALILTQSDIPPEICAPLMLLLHQTLACTRELRSHVERISGHVKGTDGAPLFALLDAYTALATERLAVLCRAAARPARPAP